MNNESFHPVESLISSKRNKSVALLNQIAGHELH